MLIIVISSSLQLSPLQSLDHPEYPYDANAKRPAPKVSSTFQPKRGSQTVGTQRRNSRTITHVPLQQQEQQHSTNGTNNNGIAAGNGNHKLFTFESFDDSIRRFQRLREIRKNLRTKYDDHSQQVRLHENEAQVNRLVLVSFVSNPSNQCDHHRQRMESTMPNPQATSVQDPYRSHPLESIVHYQIVRMRFHRFLLLHLLSNRRLAPLH